MLATGSTAAIPPIPGLRDIRIWDSRGITSAKEVPRRLVVLGGGVVGVEMAQAWRRLGAEEVTIIEGGAHLLQNEEPFAGQEVEEAFAAEGITVHTGCKAVNAARDGDDGPVSVTLDDGRVITGDELLVAVGRRPATTDVGLETIGLEPGKYVEVDDQLRAKGVDGGWLYAVGDVNGRALLTHMGKYQARLAADHIRGRDVSACSDRGIIPRVVFTDPQVASVGLTERAAREQGYDVRTVSYKMADVSAAATRADETVGTGQLVVDEARRVVIGATFTGPDIGELLHSATVAIAGQVPLDTLWHAVPSFPTMSEVWLRLLEAYGL